MIVALNRCAVSSTKEALCSWHILHHWLSHCCNQWEMWSAWLLPNVHIAVRPERYKLCGSYVCITFVGNELVPVVVTLLLLQYGYSSQSVEIEILQLIDVKVSQGLRDWTWNVRLNWITVV